MLLFATKLGYQTRSFQAAADKLGVEIAYVTDRCGRLDDPWNDHALAVHFELPEAAAGTVLEAQRGLPVDGVLAVGDRPTIAAAYVARGLGLTGNHPASVEACRNKLRMREVLQDAGVAGAVVSKCETGPTAGTIATGNPIPVRAETAFAFRQPRRCARE